MKEPFITSDPHFFHENICKWPGARPWDCHEEMTRDMIARWNSVVSEGDKVIILGDLFNRKAIECMPLLKGRKVLVMGNHCQAPTMVYMENGIEKLLSCYEIAGGILTHIPIHTSQLERWKFNGHGHCVDTETEILTVNGWRTWETVKVGDLVYTVNPNTLLGEIHPISDVYVNESYSGNVIGVERTSFSFRGTDKHRVPFLNTVGKYTVETADVAFDRSIFHIVRSVDFGNSGVNLTDDLLRLYIWLAADGNITPKNLCRFFFSKERKADRVESILRRLNIEYRRWLGREHKISFRLPDELLDWRVKGLDDKILSCNREQCRIVLEEYSHSDGNRNIIFSSKKEEIDRLQHILTINGFMAKSHCRFGHGFSNGASYQISVTDRQSTLYSSKQKSYNVEEVNGETFWCITVQNGNFFARRDGGIYLTGNCHHAEVMMLDDEANLVPDPRYINMCVEKWDYTPVKLSVALNELRSRGINV